MRALALLVAVALGLSVAAAAPPTEEGDVEARFERARSAWSQRLDDDCRRWVGEVLAAKPDHEGAHRLLGHVRGDEGWQPGLAMPMSPPPRSGREQRQAASRAGGARSRAVAEAALAWLAAHQDADGRIDADGFAHHCPEGTPCDGAGGGHHGERQPCGFDGVTTALAVLAWSASGSTSSSGPYQESIVRALPFCRQVVDRGLAGFDAIWNVTACVEALADICGTERDLSLRAVVERGVRLLEDQQRADGGYSYVYAIGDVPTTAAVLRALGQAARAGVGVDAERVARALAFLDERVEAATGRSEYHRGAEQKGYTPTRANAAAGLAARAAVGALGEAPGLGRQLAAAREQKPRWKLEEKEIKTRDGRTVRAQVGSLYPYLWYQADLALLAHSSAAGTAWRSSLRGALAKGQRKDGHAAGSWDPRGPYSLSGGRSFVTGLGALMLLSAHRYAGPR